MEDSDWDIRRKGRAWEGDEADQRYDLTPEKLEMIDGKLLWTDEDRVALLGRCSKTSQSVDAFETSRRGAARCRHLKSDREGQIDSQKNNLQLFAFALVNIALLAVAFYRKP